MSTDPVVRSHRPAQMYDCGKPASPRHRPFCSQRCANIDLGRWLKGNYRVETDEGQTTVREAARIDKSER